MSADSHSVHDAHAHHDAAPHATRKDYVVGFVLAAILTAIPFWLVMSRPLGSPTTTAFVVMGLAAVQVVVHMIYFLHMNSRAEGGWSLVSMLFTVLFVAIVLSGSVWVMYHLNTNMMPMTAMDARQMP